jgi:Putative glycerate kinase
MPGPDCSESHAQPRPKTSIRRSIGRTTTVTDFFKQLDSLVVSGPTLTNVNDFRAILVEDPNQPSRFGV